MRFRSPIGRKYLPPLLAWRQIMCLGVKSAPGGRWTLGRRRKAQSIAVNMAKTANRESCSTLPGVERGDRPWGG